MYLKNLIRLYLWFRGLRFTEAVDPPKGEHFKTLTTESDSGLVLYFDFYKENQISHLYKRGRISLVCEEYYVVAARHDGEAPAALRLHAPANLRIAGRQIPFLKDDLSGLLLTEIYVELMNARITSRNSIQ